MMKKTILLLLAAFCGVLTVAAQDLIIKADASKVEAKVTEITPESVRYKRFSNPDGPTYVLPVSEISYIQYANGEKEYFKAAASIPATPLTPAIPAEEPAKVSAAPAAAEAPAASPADGVKYVVKEYEIGEFYNQDGIKGVVCMLSDDRQHGLVISLDEIYLHWSEFRKPDLRVIGTDNRSDGSVNMEKVAAYIAEIKDAGVRTALVNIDPDRFNCEADVYYDPMLVAETVESACREAVRNYIENLPFNGEYTNMALVDALQTLDGVRIVEFRGATTVAAGEEVLVTIDARCIPAAGYFEMGDVVLNMKAYNG